MTVVTDRTGLDAVTLRMALTDTIGADTDALGRLVGRDRRDDLVAANTSKQPQLSLLR